MCLSAFKMNVVSYNLLLSFSIIVSMVKPIFSPCIKPALSPSISREGDLSSAGLGCRHGDSELDQVLRGAQHHDGRRHHWRESVQHHDHYFQDL